MKFEKKIITIQHNNKSLYGIAHLPITDEKTPFVIFSHGFNGRFSDFNSASEFLAAKGIGSYCFDFCGGSVNSKSSLSTTEMTIFTEKEDLIAVVNNVLEWDHVDPEKLFLFGGSQGGFVTSLVAEEYRDQVCGMMLLFPAFCIPENWTERYPETKDIPDSLEFWEFTLGRAFIESIHGFQVFEHIGQYDKEVMIVHGDEDDIVNIRYGEEAASIYKNAELIVFPGEGHGFSEDGNRRLNQLIYEFINK